MTDLSIKRQECRHEQEDHVTECIGLLMPETELPNWTRAMLVAEQLLALEKPQRESVIGHIRQRVTQDTQSTPLLAFSNFFKATFTFPPLNREALHDPTGMQEQNEKLILALIGATGPSGIASRLLREGELPEFGPLISEAGMNSDVYAYGTHQVVKFVRFGEEAAKLLHDSINKLAEDPRLQNIVLPVKMLQEGGPHLLQDRIPITYLSQEMQPRLNELVEIARDILNIPNGADKSIYVGKFRLLIDNQPSNITQTLQWYDPVYLSIRQAER